MDCSTPGCPVHHQHPGLVQTHVHRADVAIQPPHSSSVVPFSSCLQSFPAPGSFPMSQFFPSSGKSIEVGLSISPSNEYSGLISFRFDWFDLLAVQGTLRSLLVFSNTTVWKHQFFGAQSSLWSNSHITPPWIEPKVSVLSFKVQVKLISFLRVYLDALAHIISILINPHCLTLSKWLY